MMKQNFKFAAISGGLSGFNGFWGMGNILDYLDIKELYQRVIFDDSLLERISRGSINNLSELYSISHLSLYGGILNGTISGLMFATMIYYGTRREKE